MAVSLSDGLLRQVDEMASELSIPRSRLAALAIEEFIGKHRHRQVTERLDSVYGDLRGRRTPRNHAGLESLRELTADDSW